MKILYHWSWILTGLVFFGFVLNIINSFFYSDVFMTKIGWLWMLTLLLSQLANVLWMISFAFRLQADRQKIMPIDNHVRRKLV